MIARGRERRGRGLCERVLELGHDRGDADRDHERPVRRPVARGSGLAERLIAACSQQCARRGATRLDWQTGPENLRAQAVYDRVGGVRERWLQYTIEVPRA